MYHKGYIIKRQTSIKSLKVPSSPKSLTQYWVKSIKAVLIFVTDCNLKKT